MSKKRESTDKETHVSSTKEIVREIHDFCNNSKYHDLLLTQEEHGFFYYTVKCNIPITKLKEMIDNE